MVVLFSEEINNMKDLSFAIKCSHLLILRALEYYTHVYLSLFVGVFIGVFGFSLLVLIRLMGSGDGWWVVVWHICVTFKMSKQITVKRC